MLSFDKWHKASIKYLTEESLRSLDDSNNLKNKIYFAFRNFTPLSLESWGRGRLEGLKWVGVGAQWSVL